MHKSEPMRPSNTGWLVADVVEDTHAFAWSRTQPDPRLLANLDRLRSIPSKGKLIDDDSGTQMLTMIENGQPLVSM